MSVQSAPVRVHIVLGSVVMAGRRSISSGGGAVLFGVLILMAVVIKYYCWFIAAAAVVGLFFAVRALARYVRERKAVAAREAEELAYEVRPTGSMGAAGRQQGCVRCRRRRVDALHFARVSTAADRRVRRGTRGRGGRVHVGGIGPAAGGEDAWVALVGVRLGAGAAASGGATPAARLRTGLRVAERRART